MSSYYGFVVVNDNGPSSIMMVEEVPVRKKFGYISKTATVIFDPYEMSLLEISKIIDTCSHTTIATDFLRTNVLFEFTTEQQKSLLITLGKLIVPKRYQD